MGIDEGGATRQGLELAMDVADRVGVFHDPSSRTFHPKVYIASCGERRLLYLGSNNLTAGGVHFNYEAGVKVALDAADVEVGADLNTWLDKIREDRDCYRELTPQLLEKLVEDPRYQIGEESFHESSGSAGIEPAERHPVFAKSSSPKRGARSRGRSLVGEKGKAAGPKSNLGPVQMRWSKRLARTDAQQTPSNTSPTGNLRLSKARHSIDHKSFFRDEFFGDCDWHDDDKVPGQEFAEISIRVMLGDQDLGDMTFRIDHNTARISGQNNVPTVLKWGPMNGILRATSYIDYWVLLEKRSEGFLLSIQESDPETT
ncbi:hypothetical protein TSOC111612_00920 [Tsukamurella ocularis]